MGQKEVPALPSIWNVPYRRNPFFTGRADILTRLHTTLTTGKTAALTQPQAISGLGGIGKTQTAIEYAYRYGSEYQAVLWAKADSREVLISDFVSIADVLNLPEKNEQDQNRIVNAVKRWLQNNRGWLLILDNVDDLVMVNDFIPSVSQGHILLTTRANVTEPIERAKLLNLLTDYLLFDTASFEQIEQFYQKALMMWEELRRPEDFYVANCLNSLSVQYLAQGKYEDAVPPLERALAIYEQRARLNLIKFASFCN